jgi:hypothetical protein
MPVLRKLRTVLDDIGEYLLAIGRHWGPLVSGAFVGFLTWVYGARTGQSVPTAAYFWILVCAALVAAFLNWREWKRSSSPLDGVLYRENLAHRQKIAELQRELAALSARRQLTHEQAAKIRAVMEARFHEKLWTQMSEEDRNTYKPLEIAVVAVGSDRETTDYRNELVEAFRVNGFVGQPVDWSAGMREHAHFNGAVTVLHAPKTTNIIRPMVLEALTAAGIEPKVAPIPPRPVSFTSWLASTAAATVIVGPR